MLGLNVPMEGDCNGDYWRKLDCSCSAAQMPPPPRSLRGLTAQTLGAPSYPSRPGVWSVLSSWILQPVPLSLLSPHPRSLAQKVALKENSYFHFRIRYIFTVE